MSSRFLVIGLTLLGASGAAPAAASSLLLSTMDDQVVDGQLFRDGDLFRIDANPGSATLALSETIFVEDEDIDAVAVQPDGSIILSVADPAQIGGLVFEDGDLVSYDPASGEANVWLSEAEFSANLDIDAAHVLPNGHLLFSVRNDVTLFPAMPQEAFYLDGDVIEYDPLAGATSLYLAEEIFTPLDLDGDGQPDSDPDVDGLSMLQNGNLLLSIRAEAMIGDTVYSDGEIIEYDPETGAASVYLSLFGRATGNSDVNAVSIVLPEPTPSLLSVVALAAVVLLRRLAQPRLRTASPAPHA